MPDLFDGPASNERQFGELRLFASGDRIEVVASDGTRLVLDKASRECSFCLQTKEAEHFGWRKMGDGTIRMQTRCNSCPR